MWSELQLNIFAFNGTSLIVAGPGCGKTTTLVELASRSRDKSVIAVAFGKDIAKVLQQRLTHGVAQTIHSVGHQTIKAALSLRGNDLVERDRAFKIADRLWPGPQTNYLKLALAQTLSHCKARLAHDFDSIVDVIDEFLIPVHPLDYETFVHTVIAMLNIAAQPHLTDNKFDYDDQIWLPLVCPWMRPPEQYDFVLVDEMQDLTIAQMRAVHRLVKPGGSMAMFGDPNQAIFGFRAAGGMNEFALEVGATALPLSICYRCGYSIVEEARRFVPRLQPAPDSKPGLVTRCGLSALLKNVRPGDFVLSRSNAPLVKLCLVLLQDGVRAQIEGRDIGSTLASFVKRQRARTVDELDVKVRAWAEKEAARLAANEPPKPTDEVYDRRDCVLMFCRAAETVEEVIDRIQQAFVSTDEGDYVTLSTVHRAKGKERDRVWLLESTFIRNVKRLEIAREKGEEVQGSLQEEANIRYVAITRAREFLAYVDHDFKAEFV